MPTKQWNELLAELPPTWREAVRIVKRRGQPYRVSAQFSNMPGETLPASPQLREVFEKLTRLVQEAYYGPKGNHQSGHGTDS